MKVTGKLARSCVFALVVIATVGRAAEERPSHVSQLASNGFVIQFNTHIAAAPDKVYATLIQPSRRWASDHTYSGDARNLHLDVKAGGCWCETLPNGGSAQHLTVAYVDPGKTLRLRGALGPFQGMGADGALTWKLQAAAEGTDLSTTFVLGGYDKDGFVQLSRAADGVLSDQIERLKKLVESR